MSLLEPSCYDSAAESPEGPDGREEGDSPSQGLQGAFKTANALTPELDDLERPFLFPHAHDGGNENIDNQGMYHLLFSGYSAETECVKKDAAPLCAHRHFYTSSFRQLT